MFLISILTKIAKCRQACKNDVYPSFLVYRMKYWVVICKKQVQLKKFRFTNKMLLYRAILCHTVTIISFKEII